MRGKRYAYLLFAAILVLPACVTHPDKSSGMARIYVSKSHRVASGMALNSLGSNTSVGNFRVTVIDIHNDKNERVYDEHDNASSGDSTILLPAGTYTVRYTCAPDGVTHASHQDGWTYPIVQTTIAAEAGDLLDIRIMRPFIRRYQSSNIIYCEGDFYKNTSTLPFVEPIY